MIEKQISALEEEKAKHVTAKNEILNRICRNCPRLYISNGCDGCDIKRKREELRKRITEIDRQIENLKKTAKQKKDETQTFSVGEKQ
jgi:hypothetical protein